MNMNVLLLAVIIDISYIVPLFRILQGYRTFISSSASFKSWSRLFCVGVYIVCNPQGLLCLVKGFFRTNSDLQVF